MDNVNTPIVLVVGQILTFLGLLAKLIFDYIKEGREREWRMQDLKYKANAERSQTNLQVSQVLMQEELEKNTALSTLANEAAVGAYKEANDVNKKIAAIGQVRLTAPGDETLQRRSDDKV